MICWSRQEQLKVASVIIHDHDRQKSQEEKEKMTKDNFEEMGGTYRQVGDYLLPNITSTSRRRNRADWFMGETTCKAFKGTL